MATCTKSYYQQLKPVVLGHVTCYRSDFLEHDRKALRGFTGRFLLGMRECGTNLLRFGGSRRPDGKFDETVEYFLFRANERFLMGDHGEIREITEQEARRVYQRGKREGVYLFA